MQNNANLSSLDLALCTTVVGWISTLMKQFPVLSWSVSDITSCSISTCFLSPGQRGDSWDWEKVGERLGGKEEWPSHMSSAKRGGKTRRRDRGLDSCCLATDASTGRGGKSLQPLPAAWRHKRNRHSAQSFKKASSAGVSPVTETHLHTGGRSLF